MMGQQFQIPLPSDHHQTATRPPPDRRLTGVYQHAKTINSKKLQKNLGIKILLSFVWFTNRENRDWVPSNPDKTGCNEGCDLTIEYEMAHWRKRYKHHNFDLDSSGNVGLNGLTLHFEDSIFFSGGRISIPVVKINFADPLDRDQIVEALGGDETAIANIVNSDGILTDLSYLDDLLGGPNAIGYQIEVV